ncbi:MAG: HEAT repeat domain-containing protein [Anaerolineae bacterium]|nr:HEAT repeat domain-containing protein [Anaerolineae bacterium]
MRDEEWWVRQAAAEALVKLGRPEGVLLHRLLSLLGYRWYLPWNLPYLPHMLQARRRGYDQEAFTVLWRLLEKGAG